MGYVIDFIIGFFKNFGSDSVMIKRGNTKCWYSKKNTNLLHRSDGPAIERTDGYKVWYFEDKRHRLDGPAVEYGDGVHKEWWIEGKIYTEEEFNKISACYEG